MIQTPRLKHAAGFISGALLLLAGFAMGQPSSSSPLAPPPNGPRRADPTWYAITGCTLHPRPGEVIPHATVVFRDGIITAILPGEGEGENARPARVPLGPRLVDGAGLHIYAAFIDACVEVDAPAPRDDASRLHWSRAVTPQRSALDGTGLDDNAATSLRRQGFGAAALSPRGGIFRGKAALVSLAKPAEDTSAARPPVYRDNVYQAIAAESGREYPGSQMGAIALMRQTFSDAKWHQRERAAGRNPEPTTVLDHLAPANTPGAPSRPDTFLFDAPDELIALRAGRIAAEFSVPMIILGSGAEFRRLDALAADGHAFILPLNFPRTPDVSSLAKQEATELRAMMTWEQSPTNARRVAAAGITFALSTARLRDRAEFLRNVRSAIRHGLTEDQALAALTTTPAALLGVADHLGQVKVNARANLLVADGPIFGKTAAGKDSRVRGLWIDGQWHEITPAPVSLEGTWDVSIPADPRPILRRLEIGADNAITLHRDGKSVKCSRVEVASGRLSFVFDHDALDGEHGLCTMAALVSEHGKGSTMTGFGVSGSGVRYEWIATRRPPSLTGVWPLPANGALNNALIIDAEGKATIRPWPGAEGDTPIEPANFAYDGATLSLDYEDGTRGKGTLRATIDHAASPPTMRGEITFPSGAHELRSARRGTNPWLGNWRITQVDGAPRAKDGPEETTIRLAESQATLTFKAADKDAVVITSRDVKYTAGSATLTYELEKLGGEGKSSDTAQLVFSATGPDDDTIKGQSTLPDGTTREYTAARVVRESDADEDRSTADIPEKLPIPFGPYGLFEPIEQPEHLIISNATIWTGAERGIIERGYVYARAGRIELVGEGDPSIAVPRGERTQIINANGKHITAGIIDAHSHTGISGGVNEGGQAVTAEVRIQDVTNPDAVNWYQQLAGGVTTVLSLHGSANAIGGQSQTIKVRWGAAHPTHMHFEGAPAGIKFALGENPRRANRGGGGGDVGRYPGSRMGVEMLIRDRFTAGREYAQQAKTLGPALRRDLELEAMAEILAGTRLVHCHSYRQDEMLMLAMVARDFGFRIGTYQHALEGYKVADYVRDWSGGASGFSDWWNYKVEVQDAIPDAFVIMHEQGAVVSYNSDSNELARRLNTEAAKAVKYGGVDPHEALKFVTLNPARQLQIDSRVGSVEEGKDADLVLWSTNPLSAFARCEATFVDGKPLFTLEADIEHRERIDTERRRLIQKILSEGERSRRRGGPAGGAPAADETPATPSWADQESAAQIRAWFLEQHARGMWHEQGVCGCDLTWGRGLNEEN
jgi:imidazolonepropionase-like amidohydrolase